MNSYAAVPPRNGRVCVSLRFDKLCKIYIQANVETSFILVTYIVVVVEELNR